jgi:homoserine O-acetyltransferase
LKIVTLQANSWEWARKAFGTAPAEEGKDPAKAMANRFKIEGFLDQAATARVGFADANHFLYLCKANQLAVVDPAKIKSPALVLYAPNDLVFYEPIVQERRCKKLRKRADRSKAASSWDRMATSIRWSQSDSRLRRSRHFWRGRTSAR